MRGMGKVKMMRDEGGNEGEGIFLGGEESKLK